MGKCCTIQVWKALRDLPRKTHSCNCYQWCKVPKYEYFEVLLKYFFFLNLFFGVSVLYYLYFWQLLLHHIPKENNLLFSPHIFPETQKYLLHLECLAGQENGLIHILIKKTLDVIPTASDLADSLNICFVCKLCLSVGGYLWLSINK